MKLGKLLLTVAAGLVAMAAQALQIPQIFQDEVVLQQNANARMWGWAKPGSKVEVKPSWGKQVYAATADGTTGRWDVALATPSASYQNYYIKVKGDGKEITINKVLVGEVWFCSGQSNMEMPLGGWRSMPVNGSNEAIATSGRYKNSVRYVTIPKVAAEQPLDSVAGRWQELSPATAGAMSAVAYFYSTMLHDMLDVPVGVIVCAWGGSRVEGWLPRNILATFPDEDLNKEYTEEYHRPYIMYNGMLNALCGYTVKGFLWNQGESNVGKDKEYAEHFGIMVKHWRERFGQGDLPFYTVEIPPYFYGDAQATNGALLREAQHKAAKQVPNCGIVCSNDLSLPYETTQIHPSSKQQVGYRLAFMAAVRTYGMGDVRCDSPELESYELKGDKALVYVTGGWDGIVPEHNLQGFEVAGDDRVFYPAKAEVRYFGDRTAVEVASDKVGEIKSVRYCFHNWSPGNVYNNRQLPLVPFRTDNWDK